MKEKELFIEALSTLFQSWGGDTPPEVHWGGNKLLDWYEQEYNIALGIRFDEENDNYDEVIETIQKHNTIDTGDKLVTFFIGMKDINYLFETFLLGLQGGIYRYDVQPNMGIFDKEYLVKFVKINQGDNDFDYELGRIGYAFLTSEDGLKRLAKCYLNKLESSEKDNTIISLEDDNGMQDVIIKNCKQSLSAIIGVNASN